MSNTVKNIILGEKQMRGKYLFSSCLLMYVCALIWAIFQQNTLILSAVSFAPFAIISLICLLFYPDYAFYTLLLCVPISAKIEISNIGFSFPSEILMLILAFHFLLKLIRKKSLNPDIVRHPISIALFAMIIISLLSTIYSEIFWVAIKRSIINALFYIVFYLSFAHEFREDEKIARFWNLQIIGMIPIIIYTLIRHSAFQFSQTEAPPQSFPFYEEHAVYGACLAFVMPYLSLRLFNSTLFKQSTLGILFLNLVLLFAQFAAASRAAWLGLVASIIFYFLLKVRISFHTFIFIIISFSAICLFYQDEIYLNLQKNNAESRTEKIDEQLASVANIKTDVSNLERVNRWWCALEMAEKRPILGWGPGNYEANYGGFQHWFNLTRISTHSGNRGNAHSEYLMFLSETGILGFMCFIFIVLTSIATGIKVVYQTQNAQLRIFALSALLGLICYYVLGIFNAFLDQDEAAIWVWGSMAILVQLSTRKT